MDINKKISELAKLREVDEVITYITGDKVPEDLFSTQIAGDVIPLFYKHLSKIGQKNKISLFLYTIGGQLEAPWPIISLIRNYCKEFEIIIPFKALSAGTLMALGADKIVMTPLSFLSPIDPQGSFIVGGQPKKIEVEDVTSFVNFAKNKVGVAEQHALSELMKTLTSEVPPSVIGSVNRAHFLIRNLATNLLKTHKGKMDEHQVTIIVESLTEKLYSHKHLISRKEAKETLGFKNIIDYATVKEEELINDIFKSFSDEMMLDTMFRPEDLIKDKDQEILILKRGILHTSNMEHAYMTEYIIQKNANIPPQPPFSITLNDKGWQEIGGKKR
jgi:ATP-dependent protease ClpP protease subunit